LPELTPYVINADMKTILKSRPLLASRMKIVLQLAAVAALTVILSNCGSKMSSQPTSQTALDSTPGTFTNVYQIFTQSHNCNQCHVPGAPAYDQNGVKFDLTSQATAFSTLVNQAISGQSSTGICGGVLEVVPGSPQTSYLAAVLDQAYNTASFAGVSSCAPFNGHLQSENLSADEISSIVSWIQGGAQNN
jgi:hypothetical protein